MHRMWRTTLLWPGLAELWVVGRWSALAVALVAAIAVDVLLLLTVGWSELVGPSLRMALWGGFGVLWVITVGWSLRRWRNSSNTSDDSFPIALDHYLCGDYYQAERVLGGLLRRDIRDIEARLMLATLFRHTGRLTEAAEELDTLGRYEGAVRWKWEVAREREFLTRAKELKAAAA